MSDLDLLREIGRQLRAPAFEEIVETRRRRTRQARLAGASAAAVVAIAVVGALATGGHDIRTDPPPVGPSETQTPDDDATDDRTEAIEAPDGQQTIVADVAPGDIRGFEELATVTNTQPDHVGETYFETTVTAHADTEYVVYDCQAHDVPTWIAYAAGDLDSDSPGGATDGWTYRPCSSDQPLSLEIDADLTGPAFRLGLEQKTVRMFALAPPPADQRECLLNAPNECATPDPIAETDAEFGFRIYEHAPAPVVLRLPWSGDGVPEFEALTILDGVGWLVDRAVVAGPRADRLVVDLPPSDEERLVNVYDDEGPGFARCLDEHQDDLPDFETTDSHIYFAAVAKVCYAVLRLTIDGNPVAPAEEPYRDGGQFLDLDARLAAGVEHQIVIEVVRGDPHNISYAVVLRNRTEIP